MVLGRLFVGALVTDLAYVLTGLWDVPPVRAMQRRWTQLRYRTLAPRYDAYIAQTADYGSPVRAALDRIPIMPRRILDVSTGTGFAAELAARRYPQADIVVCDLSPPMLAHARLRLPEAVVVCCDGGWLPFPDGTFDLVLLQNAPPVLRELARVVAPLGWLALGFSAGARLPAWLRPRFEQRMRRAGLRDVAWEPTGDGLCIVARKAETPA